jgi:tetratricopeptide (TPR) repeat protein
MLNAASWDVVRQPGAPAAVIHRALRQAEAACRNAPDSARCFTTLGVARYRLGNYQEAIAALQQADRIDAAAQNHLNPARVAFLALAQHRLGRTEETRAALSLLRESMKRPEWAESGDALSYLHEAEVIEQDLAFPADPFAH